MAEPRECPAGKVRYASRKLALVYAIRLATRQANADKRRAGRCYRCPVCHGWHITTRPGKQAGR